MLPLFHDVAGKPVLLLGDGEAAEAKERLLERAGARVVRVAEREVRLAVIALSGDDATQAAASLRAAGLLVNTVDRPDLCDFTMPAIVDREPVLIAIGTGGASAGLAKALRQRFEQLLPASLGHVAEALHAVRAGLRAAIPGDAARRRHIDMLLGPGGVLDPFVAHPEPIVPTAGDTSAAGLDRIHLRSADPDDLTLREARHLASADRLYHRPDVPAAILDRARADAWRIACAAPPAERPDGRWVDVDWKLS